MAFKKKSNQEKQQIDKIYFVHFNYFYNSYALDKLQKKEKYT